MTTIIIASNPSALASALASAVAEGRSTATVEAECGDVCVAGTMATLAHHGPRKGNPCPCLEPNRRTAPDVIGLSHVDLDSLGGVLALVGRKPEAPTLWSLAAFVDVHGAHKIADSGASPEDRRAFDAWCAWRETHRFFAPRDGSVTDATAWVEEAETALTAILDGDAALLAAGDEFRRRGDELNASEARETAS